MNASAPAVFLSALAALALAACATATPPSSIEPAAPAVPTEALAPSEPPPPSSGALVPLSDEDCDAIAALAADTLGVEVTQSVVPMTSPTSDASGTACEAMATGTGEDFSDPWTVVSELSTALEAQGWVADASLESGGPTGAGSGVRKGDQVCMVGARWEADPAANCPKDQPITACALTPGQKLYTVTIDCAEPTATGAETGVGLANPASVNCEKSGGTLRLETRGDGGQIGVCYFEDNRQCEEWALMRGDCPAGGVKVTGYTTEAGRYCAITGGTYEITATKAGADDEQGTCALPDGTVCDAWDYYNGKCGASSGSSGAASGTVAPGGAIVFDSNRGGDDRDLYSMTIGGPPPTRLTEGPAGNFAGPWSPDGTKIAFTCSGDVDTDICVIGADGTGRLNLTSSLKIDEGFPAWSPDGSRIAYTTRRDGNNEIYVMDADGSDPVRLTNDPADDFGPSWSPDGLQIAFASDRGNAQGVYDIYVMPADGSRASRFTSGDGSCDWPAWSPDGASFAYRRTADGQADIAVMAVVSGEVRLFETPTDEWAPAWSPDGSRIAFQTNRDGDWEIYGVNADGEDATNLTNDPGADDQQPHWRP